MIASRIVPLALPLLVSSVAGAQVAKPGGARMPVREVTVFKDGHSFVLQEGAMPVDAGGDVVLDDLPTPVVGTFWPYATGVKLKGVVAARQPVTVPRPALSVRDLLKANIGAEVTIIETPERHYDATILSIPQAPVEDAPPVPDDAAAFRSAYVSPTPRADEVILLQTKEGVRVAPVSSIQNVIFKTAPRATLGNDEFRNRLRLQLDWNGQPKATANVGTVYLQKGIRWIPSYRIALDGKGRAQVKMQATLVNDLVDLQNATANLVIGVPSFVFKETVDPISLQNTFARLAPLFEAGTRGREVFSNAIQSQVAGRGYALANDAGRSDGGASVAEGGGNEDFYLFTAKNISLNKGERMVFPLADYDLKYQDIYSLETPAAPPPDLYRSLNYEQQNTIAATLAKPNVMHKIRLVNNSKQPLTTAPTLIESGGRLLAQTLMTYTATGGRSDLDLAPAVDVTVKRSETETKRTPDALKWRDSSFARVDVSGKLSITSFRNEPVDLEITRQFIGTIDSASNGGIFKKLGAGDDDSADTSNRPTWWSYGDSNLFGVNGVSSATWKVTVPAKQSIELRYEYHYFWR